MECVICVRYLSLQVVFALRSEHVYHLAALDYLERMRYIARYGVAVAGMEHDIDVLLRQFRFQTVFARYDISALLVRGLCVSAKFPFT